MSEGLYLAIAALGLVAGLAVGRPWAAGVATLLWLLGLGVAALAGAFKPSGEDNSLFVFIFSALFTMFWVLMVFVGVVVRDIVERRRRPRPPG